MVDSILFSGHINYINAAKAIGGYLIVALNDDGLKIKKVNTLCHLTKEGNFRILIWLMVNLMMTTLSASPAEKIKSIIPIKSISAS